MSKNCYLWIDSDLPEEEQYLQIFCEHCRQEKHPNLGWFWDGAAKGYGPYDYICGECGEIIHKAPEGNS